MKNRIILALIVAIALAMVGPPLMAAPNQAPPVKVYTAAALPAPSIITGDLAITFPSLEESTAKIVGDSYSQLKALKSLLVFSLILETVPIAFIAFLLVNELVSRRKAMSDSIATKTGKVRSKQPHAPRAKRAKRATTKPKASTPAAAPAEGA